MMPPVGLLELSSSLLNNPIFIAATVIVMIPVGLFLATIYGFLFRKLSARFQWRMGPLIRVNKDLAPLIGSTRIWQPLYDVLKLFGKDNLTPASARKAVFSVSPYIAFACAAVALFFIPFPGLTLLSNVQDSLVIVVYLLISAAAFTVLGASAAGSPWSSIGARREIELFMVYEIGLVVSLFAVAFTTQQTTIWGIVTSPLLPMLILNPFAAALLFLVMLGKLAIKPLDIAEAECEIVAGPYTEYSGRNLGLFQLTKLFLMYDLITLFLAVFIAPIFQSLVWIPLYVVGAVVLLFLLTVVQVLHPRYKISTGLATYGAIIIVVSILAIIVAAALYYYGAGAPIITG